MNDLTTKVFVDFQEEVNDCLKTLETKRFTDLSEVGRLQGQIQGLRKAREIIELAIREPDDDY